MSTTRTARTVKTKMRMAEIPDARKVAVEEEIPACWKRRGAYYMVVNHLYKHTNRPFEVLEW